MRTNGLSNSRRLRGALVKRALLAGAACAAATGAVAQMGAPTTPLRMQSEYFGYAASVSPRVGYTDNKNLAPDGLEESTVLLSTRLNGSAIYAARRLTAVASGDLDFAYSTDDSEFFVSQDIGAAATLTAVDNLVYFDLAGSTSRQLLGENARFSSNINAARSQRVNVHTYSASPYLYREFADQSSAQLRYRFSQVFVGDDNAGANPFGTDFLNDSLTHEISAGYDSGRAFDRFRFAAIAYGARTIEDGSVVFPRLEYDQGTLMGEGQYALTDSFALSGALGYDRIDTDFTTPIFDDDELSGFFWRAGFVARPGRRSTVRIEYGRRYDDDFIDASISYRISQQLTFSAGAGQTFETRAQQVNSRYLAQSRSLLSFADRLREGAELDPDAVIATANRFAHRPLNAQTAGVGVSKNAYARLVGAYDRTEISAAAYYQDTDFGFRQNESLGLDLQARRELSRRMSAYGGLFYRRTDITIDAATCASNPFLFGFDVNDPLFDPVEACLEYAAGNGLTNTLGARVGAAYRIYKNLSAFAEYSYTTRWADSPLLEYDENYVVAGVTLDF